MRERASREWSSFKYNETRKLVSRYMLNNVHAP
jgi:hypothetical protein